MWSGCWQLLQSLVTLLGPETASAMPPLCSAGAAFWRPILLNQIPMAFLHRGWHKYRGVGTMLACPGWLVRANMVTSIHTGPAKPKKLLTHAHTRSCKLISPYSSICGGGGGAVGLGTVFVCASSLLGASAVISIHTDHAKPKRTLPRSHTCSCVLKLYWIKLIIHVLQTTGAAHCVRGG